MADITTPKTKVDSRVALETVKAPNLATLFADLKNFAVSTSKKETMEWGQTKLGPAQDVEGVPGLKQQEMVPFRSDVRVRVRFREDGERVVIQGKQQPKADVPNDLGPVQDVEGVPGLKQQEMVPFRSDVRVRVRFREDGGQRVVIQGKADVPDGKPLPDTMALIQRILERTK